MTYFLYRRNNFISTWTRHPLFLQRFLLSIPLILPLQYQRSLLPPTHNKTRKRPFLLFIMSHSRHSYFTLHITTQSTSMSLRKPIFRRLRNSNRFLYKILLKIFQISRSSRLLLNRRFRFRCNVLKSRHSFFCISPGFIFLVCIKKIETSTR